MFRRQRGPFPQLKFELASVASALLNYPARGRAGVVMDQGFSSHGLYPAHGRAGIVMDQGFSSHGLYPARGRAGRVKYQGFSSHGLYPARGKACRETDQGFTSHGFDPSLRTRLLSSNTETSSLSGVLQGWYETYALYNKLETIKSLRCSRSPGVQLFIKLCNFEFKLARKKQHLISPLIISTYKICSITRCNKNDFFKLPSLRDPRIKWIRLKNIM